MKGTAIRSCTVCGKKFLVEVVRCQGGGREPIPRTRKLCGPECNRVWFKRHH